MKTSVSERILVCAPLGRDARVACEMLKEAGLDAEICVGLPELLAQMDRGAGCTVLTEEALDTADLHPISDWIASQPEWSDYPFVLLTARGGGLERNPAAKRYLDILGNVTFLERPFHPTTFVSLAEASVRGRRRQYEARSRLEDLHDSAHHLAEERHRLETLNRTGAELSVILDRNEAVQRVTDAGVALTGAQFGAFFHNVVSDNGESYMLYALSGVDRAEFDKFPMPRATKVFEPTFVGDGIIRSDDITQDARYGQNAPYKGMPEGHLPVRSYLAVPVMSRFGTVMGGLFFGHADAGVFSERHEQLMSGLAGQAAIALDNADLFRAAERELEVRRKTEVELQASNDRFRAAIDAVQGVLWTTTPSGDLEGDQPGWAMLTGQTCEQYRGTGWAAAVHPDDREPTVLAWRRAIGEGRTFVFEHRLRRKDGEWRNFSIRAVPIFGEDGGIIQWVGVHTDITAQRAAEAALLKLNSTLEERVVEEATERQEAESQLRQVQKMEAVGQLTGGIAHDFNNLLTPIIGGLDMLRQRLDGDERAQRTIGMALQAATRASTLVQRLLAFARRQDLQPRPVNVSGLLQGMEELVSRSIGAQIRVEVDAPDDLPPAHVDPNQLELAILNLAINARDAMPDGGTVRIHGSTQNLASGTDDLGAGDYVRICVSDEGVGMDEETLRRATEPFFSTKGLGKGTGLGVSMVHGLAAQSGGALRLISAPGQGTTAEIWLPVAKTEAVQPAASATLPILAHDGGTVLLVDDEELVRVGTADMLQEFGYDVLQAGSGPEALVVLRERREAIDALVTDFLMPGMNGATLAQEARSIVPDLPVLVITGYSNIAEGPGADLPRLHKPFRQAELASQVARLMSRRPGSFSQSA